MIAGARIPPEKSWQSFANQLVEKRKSPYAFGVRA
jgi:hypothetical protein